MRILYAALLSLLLALPAGAGTLAGVTLPDKAEVKGQSLVLNGMGLRKKFVIKVYVGGLFLPEKEKNAAKVMSADAPRRMVLHFIYDVSKEQMCEAWDEGLEANTPKASADVKKAFATLCGWMDGVGKGNQLIMTYPPGEVTTVEINGTQENTGAPVIKEPARELS